jgi:ABC-type cobalamin/Fe3+-siderophores transport system ATPase subunit
MTISTHGHHPPLTARMMRVGYAARTVIDARSLEVQRGQITALVGSNGSGKSMVNL